MKGIFVPSVIPKNPPNTQINVAKSNFNNDLFCLGELCSMDVLVEDGNFAEEIWKKDNKRYY